MRNDQRAGTWVRLAAGLLTGMLALVVAGCTGRPTVSGPGPSVGATAAGASSGAARSPATTPTASFVFETRSGDAYFMSPSRNISCAMNTDAARCDIVNRDWAPPSRPASCPRDHGDYGQGLVVSKTAVSFVCAGDTVIGTTREVLEYGHGIRVAEFVCTSARTGVRCEYLPTGQGFTLAQEQYTTF
jgi:hypothetical protein